MNKSILNGLLATAGLALALSAAAGTTHTMQPLLLAHAGHAHAGHGQAAKHDAAAFANAKVSETLSVSQCWIRAIPLPAPSAGYFLVKNGGGKEAKLVAAASSTYGMIMLHQTTHEGGMSRMSETHDIAVPAGGELLFKPGGYHAMLEKPSEAPAVGSKVGIYFLFDNGEKAHAECDVKPANTKGH